jgi:hypothetical protein
MKLYFLLFQLCCVSVCFSGYPIINNVSVDSTEIIIFAKLDDCYQSAAHVFQIIENNNVHDECSSSVREGQSIAVCYFDHPQPSTQRPLTIRSYELDTQCKETGAHKDLIYQVPPVMTKLYPIQNLQTIQSPSFKAKFDMFTGTLYEFYNQNATTTEGRSLNLIHSHIGAAYQFATHHGTLNSLTTNSCGGGGYWNPTQAGAACEYPGPGILLTPEANQSGVQFNCSEQYCEWKNLKLFNFDYGPSYPGPYGTKDDFILSQTVQNFNDFLEIEYTVRSDVEMVPGISQLPTIYLSHLFDSVTYSVGGVIQTVQLPDPRMMFDSTKPRPSVRFPANVEWVSFMMNHAVFGTQAITFATVLSTELAKNSSFIPSQTPNVELTELYKRYNYSYTIPIHYPVGIDMKFWNLMIPKAYNETIATPFGVMTVVDFIKTAKSYYNESQTRLNSVEPSAPPLSEASSVLWDSAFVIDGDMYTSYSSQQSMTKATNMFLAIWLSTPTLVKQIELIARTVNNIPVGFPASYKIYITDEQNTKWNYIGQYSDNLVLDRAIIDVPNDPITLGVMITVDQLGQDDFSNYFFQLNEIKVR